MRLPEWFTKARRKYPAGAPDGKGGQWAPLDRKELGRQRAAELQARVDAANATHEPTEAIRRARALDDADNIDFEGGAKHVPFQIEFEDHVEGLIAESPVHYRRYEHALANFHKAPVKSVELASLKATQPDIGLATLEHFINHPEARGGTDQNGLTSTHPKVIRYMGQDWIIDGHHRLAADRLLGRTHSDVHYVNLHNEVRKARRKYPTGAAGGRGGQWMPLDGKSFSLHNDGHWRDARGGKAEERHLAALKAIGATRGYRDIQLSADPKHYLMAVGKDAKGRRKAWYKPEFTDANKEKKYLRNEAFHKARPRILNAIEGALVSNPPGQPGHEAAAVLKLIDRTGFRPGSSKNTQAEKKAYGATTLQAKHVKVNGDTTTFKFTGKKGVTITKTLQDPEVAAMIKPRLAQGGQLFHTDATELRRFLSVNGFGQFMPKDFRTWNGTNLALQEVKKIKRPTSVAAYKAAQKKVSSIVAAHLGNTPAMAFGSYINPKVWDLWGPPPVARKKR